MPDKLVFSDADLRRLKGYAFENIESGNINWEDLRGLLARLECGERLINALKNKENVTEEEIAWEKSMSDHEHKKCQIEFARLENVVDRLWSERDRLKAELEQQNLDIVRLKAELAIAHEEVEKASTNDAKSQTDRDLWKQRFEKLAEAANGLRYGTDWNNGTHAIKHGYRQKLLDALTEYEASK